jgi:hypothetical protein
VWTPGRHSTLAPFAMAPTARSCLALVAASLAVGCVGQSILPRLETDGTTVSAARACMAAWSLFWGVLQSVPMQAGMKNPPVSWHPHRFCVERLVVASLCHQRVRLLPLHITTTVSNCMCMSGSVRVTVRLTPDFGLHASDSTTHA